MHFSSVTSSLQEHWLVTAITILLIYYLPRTIYRLYFHPISSFPGPRLAAASTKYEFYWDFIRGGQYSKHIGKLHGRYGE